MAISIGTGSWTDSVYTGVLYPKGTKPEQRLAAYAKVFDHVEVNSGYHATPQLDHVKKWVDQTPEGFTFDFKLHRSLSQNPSHYQELADLTLQRLQPLFRAKKFGCFLLMLSPSFVPDSHSLAELDGLITALRPHPIAVELRNRAWVAEEKRESTLAYFRKMKIAWVTVGMPRIDKAGVMPAVDEVTWPGLAYLRLHGRNKEGYLNGKTAAEKHSYLYTQADLKEIVSRIKRLASEAKLVRVVANNHAEDYAPRSAMDLMRLLGRKVPQIEDQGSLFG